MQVLVLNSGSSSIKFSIFDTGRAKEGADPSCLLDGELSGVGGAEAELEVQQTGDPAQRQTSKIEASTLDEAMHIVFDAVGEQGMPEVEAVGYRVVHSGAKLDRHQRITPEVLADLEEAKEFAPLHEPEVIAVIRAGMARFPGLPHYACFDTVFHQTMPEEATTYPLPADVSKQGVRRYGFHGLSCESIVRQMRASGEKLPGRMVIAHLGSGCSVTALAEGCSVDTTMGLTPTGGVVMGTRPGDLDPGVVLYLLRQQPGEREAGAAAVETMFNHKSGMVGLTGLDNDMKLVRKAAEDGDIRAVLALKVFTRSVRKAIGGFCWLMGGVDAIVFAGGIGEHDKLTRAQVLDGLDTLGIVLDHAANETQRAGVRRISAATSNTEVLIVPAQEDSMIAVHVDRMAR